MQSGTTLDTFETHTIYSRAYRLQLVRYDRTYELQKSLSMLQGAPRKCLAYEYWPPGARRRSSSLGPTHGSARARQSTPDRLQSGRGVSEMTCSMPGAEAKQACNHVRPLTHARGRSTMHHVLYPCSCPRTCSPVAHDSSSSSETSASPFRYCGE